MESLTIESQILLLESVRRFLPQSKNKELVLPLANQWYNERSSEFLPASVFREIVASLYDLRQRSATVNRVCPFAFRFS